MTTNERDLIAIYCLHMGIHTPSNIKKQICMGREIELEAESSRMEDQTIRDIDPSFVDLDMDNDDGSSDYEID